MSRVFTYAGERVICPVTPPARFFYVELLVISAPCSWILCHEATSLGVLPVTSTVTELSACFTEVGEAPTARAYVDNPAGVVALFGSTVFGCSVTGRSPSFDSSDVILRGVLYFLWPRFFCTAWSSPGYLACLSTDGPGSGSTNPGEPWLGCCVKDTLHILICMVEMQAFHLSLPLSTRFGRVHPREATRWHEKAKSASKGLTHLDLMQAQHQPLNVFVRNLPRLHLPAQLSASCPPLPSP